MNSGHFKPNQLFLTSIFIGICFYQFACQPHQIGSAGKTTPSIPPAPLSQKDSLSPSPSPRVLPTASILPALSPTPRPSLSAFIPLPPDSETLSTTNINSIHQIAMWGKGSITETAWSPDGKYFAVSSSQGVYLLDPVSFQDIRVINSGHGASRIAFSPNGKILALSTKNVQLWDVASGSSLGFLAGEVTGPMAFLAFGSDGRTIAALGTDGSSGEDSGSKLFVWSLSDRKLLYEKTAQSCGGENSFSYSLDGGKIAYTVCDQVLVLDTITGETIVRMDGIEDVDFPIFSPDGNTFVAGSHIIEINTGRVIKTLKADLSDSKKLFTPDGQRLIFQGDSLDFQHRRNVVGWDIRNDLEYFNVPGAGNFGAFSLRPDGRELATNDASTVYFWNAKTGLPYRTLEWAGSPTAITFGNVFLPGKNSLTPAMLVGTDQGTTLVFDLQDGNVSSQIRMVPYPISDIAIDPAGQFIAVTGVSETYSNMLVYNLKKDGLQWATVLSNPYDDTRTWGLAFSQDQQSIMAIVSSFGGEAEVVDRITARKIPDGEKKTWFNGASIGALPENHRIKLDFKRKLVVDAYTGSVLSSFAGIGNFGLCSRFVRYAVSSDARYLAVGCDSDSLFIWENPSQKVAYELHGHEISGGDGWMGHVLDVAFSPSGYLLATAGFDSTIRLWDASQGTLLKTLTDHSCSVEKVVFSPDGRYLASISCDGTLRLWGLTR